MSQAASNRSRLIGHYIVGRQIGSGSFSVVWHGRHRIHGTEVAIKEIVMERLNRKLQISLLSEIRILKRINHPNIIQLHDIIEASGRIHLVLEYCRGGDLSLYIQRHSSVPEATAKHFMQQLAAGLKVLRENNLIHRDLKPQNLLLSSNDEHSVLKIADFGFARSLQPRGLAETLCGSPLYMAPEIMQLQKYDAKADLWSVGAILFQLVTGKTPFSGNNQIQLLQNIMKSNELRFPPDKSDLSYGCLDLCQKLLRRNPVERLTFEEFFNHQFLSQNLEGQSLRSSRTASRTRDCFPLVERQTEEGSQEDCLPFFLDDDSNVLDGSPSLSSKRDSNIPNYRSSCDVDGDKGSCSALNRMDITSRNTSVQKMEKNVSRHEDHHISVGFFKDLMKATDQKPLKPSSKVVDSLELTDQDYVLVSGPPMEVSSSSASASGPRYSPCKSGSSPNTFVSRNKFSRPMPITSAVVKINCGFGSLGSHSSAPSGTSQGSMDMVVDALEQPSTHSMTRISSLQSCASVITDLVNEKIEAGRQLEAFSLQLVILAIWKQALHICHTQATIAIEGSPSQEIFQGSSNKNNPDVRESRSSVDYEGPAAVCSQIEKEFLLEVGHAEELARDLEPIDGCIEMPDAVDIIFQSALTLGRNGGWENIHLRTMHLDRACMKFKGGSGLSNGQDMQCAGVQVDELMGDMESAVTLYSKAVRLLFFLLVEAPSLILNPPFSLTASDRYRLRMYIDILNNRQTHSRSQRMALLKCEDPQSL